MLKSLFIRLQAPLLALCTVGLVLLAVLNFQQEGQFQQPDDGVWWKAVNGGLVAVRVFRSSPGERAGIRIHDLLTAAGVAPVGARAEAARSSRESNAASNEIGAAAVSHKSPSGVASGVQRKNPSEVGSAVAGGESQSLFDDSSARELPEAATASLAKVEMSTTGRVADLEHVLYHTGIYGKADYQISRDGIALDKVVVIPEPVDRTTALGMRIIGLIYLAIGVYVLLRRWTAPRATHFYLFCLVSFALYALKYTGEFDSVDWSVLWLNVLAECLQPALFVHFALSFPEERFRRGRRRALLPLVYLPGVALLAIWIWTYFTRDLTGLVLHRLDQTATGYEAIFYLFAAVLFLRSTRRADTPLKRQQLKWLTRGALLAVVPFTLFYALPLVFDIEGPALLTKAAVFFLVVLPLTFSWAIVRYRLMDTDLIFKRGVAYTLATVLILGGYFGIIALAAGVAHNRLPQSVQNWGEALAIVVVAAISDPLKRRILGWVDRIFDRHRYDYRKALVEFGRGLSSETNLQELLTSIVEQLPDTLLVARVAVFMEESEGKLRMVASQGLPYDVEGAPLVLGFLDFDHQAADHSHIFLENAQQAFHLPEEEQRTAALLDLNYYLPCRVQVGNRQRTIAVIGLGRTLGGDFLSSEDVELLESLASYIGIALQNASLYAQLESKIGEFERLKEFNENIVESVNVGILALDLEGHIESWNAQIEGLTGISREEALGKALGDIFAPELLDALLGFSDEPGVHQLYKFALTARNGEQRTVNIVLAPLVDRDGASVGRLLLVDDITERTALEGQLAQSDKLSSIGLLAAGVAHEINTPLAVISSYSQMLSKQLKGDTRLAPVLDKIIQQSFRASEIASGLLNFSRTSTTEFRETDLNQVIHDTLSLLEHQFKKAQITVELHLSESLPAISGNAGKLQQVFLNLLLNAKEAMPEGGTLRLTTHCEGNVEAIVADTGQGIAPEDLKRIYDPFFTTKTMPKPGERRGTGLGLAVTYGIIQEHTGKIHVDSTVGAGTAFHLEFPQQRNPIHV